MLADEVDGYFTPASEPFRLLRFADLEIPNSTSFRFRNSQQELTCAATPYLISCLLNQGFDGVAFFKQESFVVDDLTSIFSQLNGHSILLAPHLLEPLAGEGRIERELNILQSGVYNVGFTGVADTPPARAFLAWWQDRVYDH